VRYAPGRAFPPYAFLPGRDPHPTRDPGGHAFGREEPGALHLAAERWRENEPYLFGVDLYNHGFLWEAHEAWESVWHPSKPDRQQALYLQGLIQCAAAWLKIPMGQPRGLERLAELAAQKLGQVARAARGRYMGLDLDAFVPALVLFASSAPGSIDGRPRIELED